MADNPFKLVETEDGPARLGQLPHGTQTFGEGEVWTYFCVASHKSGKGGGTVVAKTRGLWAPAVGSVFELGQPNRDAVVVRQNYQFDNGGQLNSMVYLWDSMEEGDFRHDLMSPDDDGASH